MLVARGRRPARRGPARTGSSSPASPARWASPTPSRTRRPRRCSTRSGAARTRRPATTCAASRHERLRDEPVQWPAAPGGPARNPIRYRTDDADGSPRCRSPPPTGRAVFHPRPHGPAAELPDDDYPFTFNTGRLPHQWHTMTKTGKVARLNKLDPAPFVEIHPDDAAALGIADGDQVEVASRRGRAVLPAVLTDRVQPGNCFAPFHWNDLYGEYACVNAVTDDAVDPISFQPGFKVCAVSLTKVADAAGPAAPGAAARPSTPGRAASASRPPALDDDAAALPRRVPRRRRGVPRRRRRPGAPRRRAVRRPTSPTWVDGCLAGTYSPRRAAPTPAPSPPARRHARRHRRCGRRRPATPNSWRRPSPTRLGDAGLPARRARRWTPPRPRRAARRHRRARRVTSTFGVGRPTRQRRRVLAGPRRPRRPAPGRRALRRARPRRLQLRRLLRPRSPPRRAPARPRRAAAAPPGRLRAGLRPTPPPRWLDRIVAGLRRPSPSPRAASPPDRASRSRPAGTATSRPGRARSSPGSPATGC